MRRAAVFLAVFFALLVLHTTPAWGKPGITGQSAVLIDGISGQILFEQEKDTKLPPASVTKILTAILAIESGKLDDIVTIGVNPPLAEGTKVYLEAGERVKLRDLVMAAMVHSANDAACAIAEYLGSSQEGFAQMMNAKAKELGAVNSNFRNPHGLTEEGHYTTAYDLALISRYAMNNETFRQVVQSKILDWQGEKWQTRLININELLWSYDGAIGIKTGYTKESRNTIVASAVRDDRMYIAVVLNSAGQAIWEDAKKLLDYGFSDFQHLELASSGSIAANIEVDDNRSLQLVSKDSFSLSVAADAAKKVESRITLEPLAGKITKGEIVGKLQFTIDGNDVGGVDLIAGNDSDPPLELSNIFLYIGAGLFGLQVLWRIYLLLRRRRRKAYNYRRQYYQGYNRINRDI